MTDSEKLDLILSDMQNMKSDMQSMKQNINNIELHLENVTDNNIKIVAEGHADLTRKLDEALKVENEKELLLIRVSYLESEIKQIKERLKTIA